MKKITVNSEVHGTHEVLIDEEDWRLLNEKYENINIYINKDTPRKNKQGKETKFALKYRAHVLYGPYGHSPSQRKQNFLHILIMEPPKGLVVDHINGNPLDNRRSNLRVCTYAKNARNNTLSITSKMGLKGVQSAKANGSAKPFRARIKYNYKEIQLGTFVTKEEAAIAYDNKAKELFGEYAKLNYPQGPDKSLLEYIKKENIKWEQSRPIPKRPYRGVARNDSIVERWSAGIRLNKKSLHLGSFDTPEEAARAYDKEAIRLLGSKAKLNFPREDYI